MIDANVTGQDGAIVKVLANRLGVPDDSLPLRQVLLTHAHADHYGSALELARRTGAELLGSADEADAFAGRRPLPEPRLVDARVSNSLTGEPYPAAIYERSWLLECSSLVRSELRHFRGQEIDTAGDGLLATFDGPARAIRCAYAISDHVESLGLQIRAGLHTGEVELSAHGPRGLAVHIGARVGAAGGAGEILVSRTAADLVIGLGMKLIDRDNTS